MSAVRMICRQRAFEAYFRFGFRVKRAIKPRNSLFGHLYRCYFSWCWMLNIVRLFLLLSTLYVCVLLCVFFRFAYFSGWIFISTLARFHHQARVYMQSTILHAIPMLSTLWLRCYAQYSIYVLHFSAHFAGMTRICSGYQEICTN